jgi:hypothetical protein
VTAPRCFCVNGKDNVATLLDDLREPGSLRLLGTGREGEVKATEPIALGHKVALRDIASGQAVVKYGIAIGHATRQIRAGQWVHLHNCASDFDERSQTLDPHSGAATDTTYE